MTVLIVLVLGLGLAYRNAPRGKPDFVSDILGPTERVLIYIGNTLMTGPLRLNQGGRPRCPSPPARSPFGVSLPSGASKERGLRACHLSRG